ncbi:MAG: universal stress protein [Corynebacterium provencense]|jgi:nucleotide-binding universal stress UspA family protein|uniref:universal stress protein n=1 Tax=Corynebacterium provencense TaxID=1737425 RepID=UPI002989C326|nr:universal stress protein [Corynebacterium provencense]
MSSDTSAHTDSVLIAFDGSDQARDAIKYAARLLSSHKAYIITAWEPIHRQAARAAGVGGLAGGGQGIFEDPDDVTSDPAYIDATQISHEGVALAAELGFETEPYLVESTTAVWSAIVEASQELGVDLIVAGTRALTGWRSLLQSSVADNLVKHAQCPVLVVPPLDEQPEQAE